MFIDFAEALATAEQLLQLYTTQAAVTANLGISVGNAARKAAALGQQAFDLDNRVFPGSTSKAVFDAIASLAASVHNPSFGLAMSSRRELLSGLPAGSFQGSPDPNITLGSPKVLVSGPPSPMAVSRSATPYNEELEVSQGLQAEPKSPSPHSPPHKRARASSTTPTVHTTSQSVPRNPYFALMPPPPFATPTFATPGFVPVGFTPAAESNRRLSSRASTSQLSQASASGSGSRPQTRSSGGAISASRSQDETSQTVRKSTRRTKAKK